MTSGDVRILRVEDDVSYLVDDLFRRTFGDPAPTDPVHYVAMQPGPKSQFEVVGYYHVAHRGEYALVGGLCVAESHRRRGIGEQLERRAFADPAGALGFFAHVGDAARAKRVGFNHTRHEHLVVAWVRDVPPSEQERIIDEVAALGPF